MTRLETALAETARRLALLNGQGFQESINVAGRALRWEAADLLDAAAKILSLCGHISDPALVELRAAAAEEALERAIEKHRVKS